MIISKIGIGSISAANIDFLKTGKSYFKILNGEDDLKIQH
jgi:hypothetical protein